MDLTRTWMDDSPDPLMVRVCADVTYDDRPGHHETYWVDLPRRCAMDITTTANPWAVALLPVAATLREPLRLCSPVDSTLLANLRKLVRIWRCWYPALLEAPIVAEVNASSDTSRPERTVAFFSGGIDSFFTLLRDRERDGERPVDDLLAIWGFDVPLSQPEAFQRLRAVLQNIADASGKELITAATNLSETRWHRAPWGTLVHASALVSIALMLERRWTRVLISSTYGYAHLHPWGSHPLTDPLLSTSQTVVVHDGAESNRVDKTRVATQSPLAMRSLRVCYRSKSDKNCGACEKCYRTMTTLWLLGVLEQCSTFVADSFDPGQIDRIFCRNSGSVAYMQEVRELALTTGRGDVASAIDRGLARSRRLLRHQAALAWLRTTLKSHSVLRRATSLVDRVERRLFRNTLR